MGRVTTNMLPPEYAGDPLGGYISTSGFDPSRIAAIADASIMANVMPA